MIDLSQIDHPRLDYTPILDAIKNDPFISERIGSEVFFGPPQKRKNQFVMCNLVGTYLKKTDDQRVMFMWDMCDWRIHSLSTMSRWEMSAILNRVNVIIYSFFWAVIGETQIIKINKKKEVFFGSEVDDGKKALIFDYEIVYARAASDEMVIIPDGF